MVSEMLKAILDAEATAQEAENKAKADAEEYLLQSRAQAEAKAKDILADAEAKSEELIRYAEFTAKEAEKRSLEESGENSIQLKESALAYRDEAIKAVIDSL